MFIMMILETLKQIVARIVLTRVVKMLFSDLGYVFQTGLGSNRKLIILSICNI